MDNYYWTQHALYKLKQYGLSQQRIKRVIRNPGRVEEGIVPKTIACMQRAGSQKHPYEIWCMYQARRARNSKSEILNPKQNLNYANRNFPHPPTPSPLLGRGWGEGKIKIISAWRYPGISPKNNPIPSEILDEIRSCM